MYIDNTFPPDGSRRLAQFLRGVTMLDSDEIALAVEALIAKLDELHGDPDLEEDDPAGTNLDRGESGAWIESIDHRVLIHTTDHEDDEDDDPDQCTAGDDGMDPVMTRFGLRWGSNEYECDREPEWCGSFAKDVEAGTLVRYDA